MKKMYLRDGEEVIFHKEIDKDNFIIERLMVFYDYKGNEDSDTSGVKELVNEIFSKPPISKKNDELIIILDKITEKSKEYSALEKEVMLANNELRKIQEIVSNSSELIINRGQLKLAKKITFFEEGGYMPKTLNPDKHRDYRVSINFDISNGKETSFYQGLTDDGYNPTNRIDDSIGFILDASDDEIFEITRKRIANIEPEKIGDFVLNRIDDKFLTEGLLKRKKQFKMEDSKNKIKKIEDEIDKKKTQLRELKRLN